MTGIDQVDPIAVAAGATTGQQCNNANHRGELRRLFKTFIAQSIIIFYNIIIFVTYSQGLESLTVYFPLIFKWI
jgi:hypothetical protein